MTTPNVHTFEDPARVAFHQNERRTQRTLHVEWSGNSLKFSVYSSLFDVEDAGTSNVKRDDVEMIIREITDLFKQIGGRRYTSTEGRLSQILNLKGIGASLYSDLIPTHLSRHCETWKDGDVVGVSSNEDWIPWELLHDGFGFWGERFNLFRLPRLPANEVVMPRRPGEPRDTTMPPRLVHVIGGDLTEEQVSHSRTAFEVLRNSVQVCELLHKMVGEVVVAFRAADVIHFSCHGHNGPLRLQTCLEDDPSVCLTRKTLRAADIQLPRGAVVFANACNSAKPELTVGNFVSFGWEFYLHGVSTYIGTIGAVPVDGAFSFAAEFYELLLKEARGSAFLAFDQLRSRCGKAGELPIRVLYAYYGNPSDSCNLFSQKESGNGD